MTNPIRNWLVWFPMLWLALSAAGQRKSLNAFLSEADSLKKQGKIAESVQLLRDAAAAYPNEPSSHFELAKASAEGARGNSDMAAAAYEKAIELEPEGQTAAQARKGLESIKKNEPAGMVSKPAKETASLFLLQQDLQKNPNDFNLLLNLARQYSIEKNWIKAVETYQKAVRIDSTRVDVWLLLARAVMQDAMRGYDERVYRDQSFRTHLAFEAVRTIEKAYRLDPKNPETKLLYAVSCVQMPFFVMKMDQGLAILEQMAKDASLPDSLKAEVLYQLGFGYRKKGNAIWMQLVKNLPNSDAVQSVYQEYGTREQVKGALAKTGEKVIISFHLGFRDELEPQTALWVEDKTGRHVKTLYVSGFSGYAREKQIVLPEFGARTQFQTDGATGASIDWGRYTYIWDLTDSQGKRVPDGAYIVQLESSWWPSMRYELANAEIRIGKTPSEVSVEKKPFIPILKVKYER